MLKKKNFKSNLYFIVELSHPYLRLLQLCKPNTNKKNGDRTGLSTGLLEYELVNT